MDTSEIPSLEDLSDIQSKSTSILPERGNMFPQSFASLHPAGDMLRQYGTDGTPVDIDETWTLEQLDMAVEYGCHPSAMAPEAAQCVREEAEEKIAKGFCRVVKWSDLRHSFQRGDLRRLKVSPLAAIPHKSRKFRMLLDLSAKARRTQAMREQMGTTVNEATRKEAAPLPAMAQLGQVLPRIINTYATLPQDRGPIMAVKWDIKDGFWRVAVHKEAEEEFGYPLPKLSPDEDTYIVIPVALQMGWTSSPPFFCAATETGRDLAEWFRLVQELPKHSMEDATIAPTDPQALTDFTPPAHWSDEDLDKYRKAIHHLFEIFVDDYIALVQSQDPEVLRHHSRAMLHAIHQIFPKAQPGNEANDPVSQKKLLEGEGVWAVRKEILGWIFDGLQRTIELPATKVAKIQTTIRSILRAKHCTLSELESITGKLQHAALGVPGGRGLLQPLYKLMATCATRKRTVQIPPHCEAAQALKEFSTLFALVGKRPTSCRQLVPDIPDYIGYCDACNYGAGGVWHGHSKNLHPIVWRVKWPPKVQAKIQDKSLTINDLEMAGIVLQCLVLFQLVPLKDTHLGIWCDNTSAVSWSNKLSSKRSRAGQHLARALSLFLCKQQTSPLTPFSIPGKLNDMADLASRSFKATGVAGNYCLNDTEFLTKFNASFPLTQGGSWKMLRLNTKCISLVSSALQTSRNPMGSWLRPRSTKSDIGTIGSASSSSGDIQWTSISTTYKCTTEIRSSKVLPSGYDKEMQDVAIKSKLAQSRMHSTQSGRLSNWLANEQTPSTKPPVPPNTTEPSSDNSKDTGDRTPNPSSK